MPKIYMSESKSSGLDVTYYRKDRRISFGGWYDHCVGIEPTEMSLGDFFRKLGITLRDCHKALIDDTP
jgi:hypothetical protein